jgi:hypothetical protein
MGQVSRWSSITKSANATSLAVWNKARASGDIWEQPGSFVFGAVTQALQEVRGTISGAAGPVVYAYGLRNRPSRLTAFGWTADEARSAGFRLLMTPSRHRPI